VGGDNLSVDKMWITGRGVLITLYDNMSPPPLLAWGIGPPPLPYPPLYMSFCQIWGDNPLYNAKIIFGKKITLFLPVYNGGVVISHKHDPLL